MRPARLKTIRLNHILKRSFKYPKNFLRWAFRLLLGLFLLFLLVAILLQFSSVQTLVTRKVISEISGRTGTEMSLQKISLRIPFGLGIRGLYLEDQQGDTLLYAGNVRLDINMLALMRKRIKVSRVRLENVTANITRLEPDTVFNFEFIINSLSGNNKAARPDLLKASEPASWKFDLGRLEIRNVSLRFADYFSGIDLRTSLGSISTTIDSFDPALFRYHFGKTNIERAAINLALNQPSRPAEKTVSQRPDIDLALPELMLSDFSFDLQTYTGLTVRTQLEELALLLRKLDVTRQNIEMDKLTLSGLLAEITLPERALEPEAVSNAYETPGFLWADTFGWRILAGNFQIRNSEVAMATLGAETYSGTFDSGNFRFSDLEFLAENLQITPEIIKLRLRNMKARSGSDFHLNRLSADIELGQTMQIAELYMETRLSFLQGDINAGFSPLEFPIQNFDKTPVYLNINQGRIGMDMAFFAPELREYFTAADRILFAAIASGTTSNLQIDTLWVEGPGVFKFALGGNINNLPNMENLQISVPKAELSVNFKKIRRFIPQDQLPENLALPDSLRLVASAMGSIFEMLAEIDLFTSFGHLNLNGTLTELLSENPGYDLTLLVGGFDPGKLLMQQELLGPVYAKAEITGKGLNPDIMQAAFNLLVSSATIMGYEYKDLSLTGEINAGVLDATIEYLDEHLGLKATNRLTFTGNQPHVVANWEITHSNPHALNFTDDEFLFQAELTVDLKLTQPDFAEGSLLVQNARILSDQGLFTLDKLEINTSYSDNLYLLNADSPLFSASFSGSASPLKVPEMLAGHFADLMGSEADPLLAMEGKGSFEFKAEIMPSLWFTDLLLPELSFFDPIAITGQFDGQRNLMSLQTGIPLLQYGNLTFQRFSLNADSRAGEANISAKLSMLEGDGLQIRDLSFEALLRNRLLSFGLAFNDRNDENWLNLSGNLKRQEEQFLFSLNEEIMINREPWLVDPDNQIAFGKEFLVVNRFRVGKNNQYLQAQSRQVEEGFAPLYISFNGFDLGQFFAFDQKPIAGGIFNGKVTINQMFNGLAFESDLRIDRFSFRGNTIGDIHVLASNPQEDLYFVEALIKGFGNEVDVQGTYRTGEQANMDLDIRLREVNLSTLEGLTAGQLTGLQGQMKGNLRLRGSPVNPEINGYLQLSQAAFRVGFINAPYRIPEGQVSFDRNTISFQNFNLLDSLGRSATLAGSINISDFGNPVFNLNLNSRNFLLMNVAQGQNDLFWGRMFIDSDLALRGNITNPVVEGLLKLNQGSFFTLVVPQTLPEAIGDQGVVEFVSLRDPFFPGLAYAARPKPLMPTFRNLKMTLNVEIDPQTNVKVIIDEFAGDYLEMQGGGVLSYGIDPGGQISLAGQYEITDGSYLLTFYDVIRRSFQIQRGGSIVFTGDPMQARVDITAIYNLRTSARELFESPMAGTSVDPALRQEYPFQVFLRMRGQLLNPEISFEIGLPEDQRNAMDGRLQGRLTELSRNESELNKQVFALLLLGSFVQENPLVSMRGEGGFSSTARNSASRILSQQLNRISDHYIRGIDLNFEVESYEDFTTGQASGRTDLQVEVSRNFFDERLHLTMGGNIELEDETRRQTNPGEIVGDFLLEYMLNPQGTLILRGFRKKDYRDLFEGEVIQTGVSLLLTRSFNQFRELFMRREESPEIIMDEELKGLEKNEE